ncbi:MAG: hypothetical protein ACK47B_24285 [Armatimonadota bacterium]
MRAIPLILCLVGLTVVESVRAHAQAPAPESGVSVFEQVIPNPTGENGYEELVLAGQMLKASPYAELLGQNPPLSVKRKILADRTCQQALRLLRRGVEKPVLSPRQQVTFSTLLPELSLFRNLGRLLAVEQYVLLADGKTTEAVGEVRLCFRFAEAIQTDTIISGLVGVAIATVCLQPMLDHLDQLSVRDLQALQAVCLEWLAKPSPLVRLIEAERFSMRHCLAEMRDNARQKGLLAAFSELTPDSEEVRPYAGQIPATEEGLDRFFGQVHQEMDRYYARTLEELKKPAWLRQIPDPEEGKDLPGAVARALLTDFGTLDDRYTHEAAKVRLMVVHTVIRRYRWEHDALPDSLEGLRLGELARDPFNGASLEYVWRGSRYSLTSIGAPASNADDPRQVNGRIPVALTPDD